MRAIRYLTCLAATILLARWDPSPVQAKVGRLRP
jgi:hypothetical protein